MKQIVLILVALLVFGCNTNETTTSEKTVSTVYEISFENAVHHEAQIEVTFSNLKAGPFEFRMSRTSPGRYALHEFAKNVYNVKATDGDWNELEIERPDPYSWIVDGHNGTVNVSYTLFANRGGGTYAQVDDTHAHLNMPATFMYAPSLEDAPMEITFDVREDLNWKVATQLEPIDDITFRAPNLQYFMDSPTEISDHDVRSFDVDGQTIHFVLHHNGTDAELDEYFEQVKPIVLEQKEVFGELPNFDFSNYYFLACYVPNASGDGMEHRNSTILTSTRSLANQGMRRNIGTVSHEFFHAWNVERIRPQSLEPFDFEEANMSGELWFAEGFTSYYTGLILCRAGLRTPEEYVAGLRGTLNYVWKSPGRQFFNPIEMSYQAPFVDAARSVDPVNRDNTFISYYSYGSALGLALDLSLRQQDLNLDDYMKLVWITYGKDEIPYTIKNLEDVLKEYAGAEFGESFFADYIHNSGEPNMWNLFETVGVTLELNDNLTWFGRSPNNGNLTRSTMVGSPAYNAGLEKGDKIISIGDFSLSDGVTFNSILQNYKPLDTVKVVYERLGEPKETELTFLPNTTYEKVVLTEEISAEQQAARDAWLNPRRQD